MQVKKVNPVELADLLRANTPASVILARFKIAPRTLGHWRKLLNMPRHKRWTREDDLTLIELVSIGELYKTIGKRTGRTGGACKTRAATLRRRGYKLVSAYGDKSITAARVREARERGLSRLEIAVELRLCRETVYRYYGQDERSRISRASN